MNLNRIKTSKLEIVKISVLSILFVMLYFPTFHMFIYDWSNDENYCMDFWCR